MSSAAAQQHSPVEGLSRQPDRFCTVHSVPVASAHIPLVDAYNAAHPHWPSATLPAYDWSDLEGLAQCARTAQHRSKDAVPGDMRLCP